MSRSGGHGTWPTKGLNAPKSGSFKSSALSASKSCGPESRGPKFSGPESSGLSTSKFGGFSTSSPGGLKPVV